MSNDINLNKNELDINFKKEDDIAKSKSVNKISKIQDSSININESTTNIAGGLSIGLSYKDVKDIVKEEVDNKLSNIYQKFTSMDSQRLKKAVKKNHPVILLENWNEELSDEQINEYFSDDDQVKIRNKIKIMSLMTRKDYDLYKIYNEVSLIASELRRTWHLPNRYIYPKKRVIKMICGWNVSMNALINDFVNKYGNIAYEDVQNIERIGLIYNDGNSLIPFKEMLKKSFINSLLTDEEKKEYETDKKNSLDKQSMRRKWTRIFFSKNDNEIDGAIAAFKNWMERLPILSYESKNNLIHHKWFSYSIL